MEFVHTKHSFRVDLLSSLFPTEYIVERIIDNEAFFFLFKSYYLITEQQTAQRKKNHI